MADRNDLVVNHLAKLYKHRELLAAAYHQSVVGKAEDPGAGRGLYELHQAKILVPYGQDTYRLASSLRNHLDEVLQAEHLYAAVGADIGVLADRLKLLADEVAKAALEGRNDDLDQHLDQFDRAVFALSDSITGALQYLRILVDNKFANVSSYEEKRRQNEYYYERAKRISEALSAIQLNGMVESLAAAPDGERLQASYHSQIAGHLPEWRSHFLDITAILRDYLFRTRQIDAVARSMRAFAHFLKRSPDYVPANPDDTGHLPSWLRRAPGFVLKSHACVGDSILEEMLLDLARSIPAVKPLKVRSPRVGTLLPDSASVPADDDAQPKPWQTAIVALLAEAGTTPISALDWKASHQELSTLGNDLWLLCLLHEESLGRRRSANIRFEQIVHPGDALSGVVRIKDILLSRRET